MHDCASEDLIIRDDNHYGDVCLLTETIESFEMSHFKILGMSMEFKND